MNHLINIIEDPPCGRDDEERVVNGFVTLILSYNQHFEGEFFYAEDVLHNYIELSVSLWPYIIPTLNKSALKGGFICFLDFHRCKEQHCYASVI